jgi:hypothetical protein
MDLVELIHKFKNMIVQLVGVVVYVAIVAMVANVDMEHHVTYMDVSNV